jgi:hypothetical protein
MLGHWLSTMPAWWEAAYAAPGYGLLDALKYSPARP